MDYLFVFLLGSVLGSFYNVLIYRLPRRESIISPPSHCPSCGSKIRWYDNIPIISYFLLKGKCRDCFASISLRYPLVEFLSGLLALLCYFKWSLSFESFVMFVFFSLLLILSFIDWDTFTLPDSLNLGGLAFGLVSSFFRENFTFWDSVVGALVGAVPFFLIYIFYVKVRKIEGIGFGDVKLMAFIGSVAGVWGVASAVFLGSLFGLLYAIPLIIKYKNISFAVPYGPFLSLGCFVGVMLRDWLSPIILQQ
ncbi:prepilin peptidase [Hydrogenobacter hydrogenophilus]|uniref:Prepilin leader peptidase/N-methyltransferase n=1 Tax=Hydrogenobacter hydrogenophilus TaxID=35835 RepID=A0A285NV27_9AQUI|nr:A24 family peptidase [Hydrogenobacter hydrogenophilus]SNZ13315.1 type 4 prepilin peptidase 1 Aspartic peptidase. MEROPS family A24A [Hydrogenobacter hydrogenophilus]